MNSFEFKTLKSVLGYIHWANWSLLSKMNPLELNDHLWSMCPRVYNLLFWNTLKSFVRFWAKWDLFGQIYPFESIDRCGRLIWLFELSESFRAQWAFLSQIWVQNSFKRQQVSMIFIESLDPAWAQGADWAFSKSNESNCAKWAFLSAMCPLAYNELFGSNWALLSPMYAFESSNDTFTVQWTFLGSLTAGCLVSQMSPFESNEPLYYQVYTHFKHQG